MNKKITVLSSLLVVFPTLVFAAVFENPAQANSIVEFISLVLKSAVTLALPVVAVYIIYSGFLFLFAQGNQEKLSAAKTNFLWVILGSILILGAWMFAEILANTASKLTNNNAPNDAMKSIFDANRPR